MASLDTWTYFQPLVLNVENGFFEQKETGDISSIFGLMFCRFASNLIRIILYKFRYKFFMNSNFADGVGLDGV